MGIIKIILVSDGKAMSVLKGLKKVYTRIVKVASMIEGAKFSSINIFNKFVLSLRMFGSGSTSCKGCIYFKFKNVPH